MQTIKEISHLRNQMIVSFIRTYSGNGAKLKPREKPLRLVETLKEFYDRGSVGPKNAVGVVLGLDMEVSDVWLTEAASKMRSFLPPDLQAAIDKPAAFAAVLQKSYAPAYEEFKRWEKAGRQEHFSAELSAKALSTFPKIWGKYLIPALEAHHRNKTAMTGATTQLAAAMPPSVGSKRFAAAMKPETTFNSPE